MSEYIVRVDGVLPDAIYERETTEIVRCRDCVYKRRTWNGHRPGFIDAFFCSYTGGHEVKPDDYCSRGKREVG